MMFTTLFRISIFELAFSSSHGTCDCLRWNFFVPAKLDFWCNAEATGLGFERVFFGVLYSRTFSEYFAIVSSSPRFISVEVIYESFRWKFSAQKDMHTLHRWRDYWKIPRNSRKSLKIASKTIVFFFLAESSKTPSKCWNIVEYIRQRPFDSHIH